MRSSLLLVALLSVTAHAAGLDSLIGEFQADRRDLASSAAVSWSSTQQAREKQLLTDWQKRLDGLDYEKLDPTARIDWHLLNTSIQENLDELDLEQTQLQETRPLLAFADPLLGLTQELAERKLADPQSSAATLSQAIADLKELRQKLNEGRAKDAPENALKVSQVPALRAAGEINELKNRLRDWYSLYDGFQPEFTWWNRESYEQLTKALGEYSDFLRKDIAGQKGEANDPLVGNPIGADAIRNSLRAEMIPYSADELINIANRQFSWCEAEMKKAAAEMGCSTTQEALEKVKSHLVPPGGQAGVAISEAEKAIAFLKEKDLVTIPPLAEETWGIDMLGPEQQKTLPYAVYGQPHIMVAYGHEDMDYEQKLQAMRGNAYGFMHIVTPHELIPGHHLQGFMARRYAAYRSMFRTPFLIEGWALHWEMELWDQGYIGTPEEKVGALFWRMHRCARIIVSLKFHLGEMTPNEMIDFLVDRVGHERAGATAEVRRYIGPSYGPLYQAAYMIGGLQIHAMQKELTAPSAGNEDAKGKLSLREFHDQILHQGPIPIEMIRAALKGESLPKDWQPNWKFAG
ncbi:DUF885 family protein [Luteolibacter pohnpeiensis]|uniref:DUF885 family protein n=1 Tax=Luteolibacter pohnpeiensis TaxID=454153 RepID=A0A934SAT9_9BACT|nr:DUF885 family protein [Luteolibacter pohnpeiensis]MBK1881928.1 DUF885 family protein [Luteolibacter pohnpeiensis]